MVMAVSLVSSGRRAEVPSVSTTRFRRRAVVMVVSRWPASAVAEVSLVSKSPRVYVLCAKKFVLQAQNGRKTLFSGVLGEFFRGGTAGGAVLGEFFAPTGTAPRSCWRRAPPLELRDRLDSGGL